MTPRQTLAAGAAIGAGLMYVLDPGRGRRRRALLRDQARHLAHRARTVAAVTSRDLVHRSHGLAAGLRARRAEEPVTDEVLVARVRAALGLVVRHPHRVDVTAESGRVVLRGEVEDDELYRVWSKLASVPGVVDVEDRLEVTLNGESAEPHERAPRGGRPELLQERWSPAARLLVGTIGGGLALGGLLRGDLIGTIFGLGLFGRAVTNLEVRRLIGIGAGRRAIDLQKSINIAAPVEQVFALWSHYERFPQIMDHVREVQCLTEDRSRWVVSGPLGCPMSWQAVVTRLDPNATLAWKTEARSMVAHEGEVRFQPNLEGGTHVDIRMSYNPPGGALGHAVALLLGCDPKHMIDSDLVRVKSFIERGKTTAHHHKITREMLPPETPETVPELAAVAP